MPRSVRGVESIPNIVKDFFLYEDAYGPPHVDHIPELLMFPRPSSVLQKAVTAGDSNIIEFILNLIFICNANLSVVTSESIKKMVRMNPQPFDKWFSRSGMDMDMSTFELCVEQTTDERIRHILVGEQRSLVGIVDSLRNVMASKEVCALKHKNYGAYDQLLDSIRRRLSNIHNHTRGAKKRNVSMRSKPLLQIEDDDEMYSLSVNDYREEEEEEEDEKYDTTFKATQAKQPSPPSIPENSQCEYDLSKDFPAPGNISISISSSQGQHKAEIEWDNASRIKSEWDFMSDVDDTSSHNTEWDILSEVQSVKSFETFTTFSFKDALMKKKKDSTKKQVDRVLPSPVKVSIESNNCVTENKQRSTVIPTECKERNTDIDPYFERDGYKLSRGGKTSKMFNTNERTTKRCPRRYRLGKYL